MRPIRVLFVGFEPFWMRVAVTGLMKRYAGELDCSWMMWPSTPMERVRFLRAALGSNLVVRLGMPFEFQSETNRVFLLLLRLVPSLRGANYWIGSDANLFLIRRESGELTRRDLKAIGLLHHFAATESLRDRLRAAGVPAVNAELMGPEREIPELIPALPVEFRVLSYWNDARFEYCGGPEVLSAARLMPEVTFDVLGTTGAGIKDAPPNVEFHGHVDDVLNYLERVVVYVRLVASDAMPSSMVEEALLMGRYVIYSFEWPHTVHVPLDRPDILVAALWELEEAHARGELPVNAEGRAFTLEDSNADAQAALMRDAIVEAASHRL